MRNILILFCMLLIGCKQEKAPYQYLNEINSRREKIGLKKIDSTFIRNDSKNYSTYDKVNKRFYDVHLRLKNEYRKANGKPTYWKKIIRLDKTNGKLNSEEDIFRSGFYKFGFMEETDIYEQLKFIYVFEDYKYYSGRTKDSILVKKGWLYKYEYPVEKKGVTSNRPQSKYWVKKIETINKSQADSILKSWGLEY